MHKSIKILAAVVIGLAAGVTLAPVAAEATVRYFSTTTIVSGTGAANCPAGWRLTGGGAGPLPTDTNSFNTFATYEMRGSYPSGNGWRAEAHRHSGQRYANGTWNFSNSAQGIKVFAICTH